MLKEIKSWAYNLLIDILAKCYLAYLWARYWYDQQNYLKKHVSASIKGGKISFTITEHRNFTEQIENKIKKLQQSLSLKKVISRSLTKALTGCNFVVFREGNNDRKFIYIHTSNGKLSHHFVMSKEDNYKSNRLALIGLLSELNFVKKELLEEQFVPFLPFKSYKYSYWQEKEENIAVIRANFHKNIDLCTKYVYSALTEVLKINPKQITIKFY